MKKYVIIIFVLFILLFLSFILIKDNRKLTIIESTLKDSISFVQKGINIPIKFIKDELVKRDNKNNIYDKYKKLKLQLEDANLIRQKYNETLKELNDLKENVKIKDSLIDYEVIDAYTINRDVGYWYQTVTINKGENDGIKVNMAVINNNGLIGRVIKTTYTTSTVKLLTGVNINNRISVKIKVGDDYLYGLLSSYNNKKFIVEGISDNREIPENSVVTTTGLDNIFPSGIEIGYVDKTSTDNFDLSRTIYIRSFVDFDDINYIMVLRRLVE